MVVVALLALAGCSHGTVSQLPTSPTPAADIMTSLTVTPVGGGAMIVGSSAPITSDGPLLSTGPTLGAFAQYRDGSGKYVPASWTSSNDTVIAIDGSAFIAKGRGTAVITATAAGKTASETFVVEPGIAGSWSGTYVVDTCEASSGSMEELICYPLNQGRTPGALAIGSTPPIAFVITQSGNDLAATVQFGELRGVLSGNDRGQNYLTLLGDVKVNATTMSVIHWDTQVREDLMEGFIGLEVRIAGVSGHARVTAHFDKVTRR